MELQKKTAAEEFADIAAQVKALNQRMEQLMPLVAQEVPLKEVESKTSNSFVIKNREKKLDKNRLSRVKSNQKPTKVNVSEPTLELPSQDSMIIEAQPEKAPVQSTLSTAINDKFLSFKNMMANLMVKCTPHYGFVEQNKTGWANVGSKVKVEVNTAWVNSSEKGNAIYQSLKEGLKKTTANVGARFENIQGSGSTKNGIMDYFFLVGESHDINKLQKNFTETLSLMGFEAKDIAHNVKKETYMESEAVTKNITNKIVKDLALVPHGDGVIKSNIMEGLADDLKFETVQKVLWPKLKKTLKQSMDLALELQSIKNDNKYIKIVMDVAKTNNISSDIVAHALSKDLELLKDFKGASKLIENKEQILENVKKYEILGKNNLYIMKELVKASEWLNNEVQTLNINADLKTQFTKDMQEGTITSNEKNTRAYSLNIIRNNVLSVLAESNKTSSLTSANENKVEAKVETQEVETPETPSTPKNKM